jgi:hypothetical protein
MQSPPSLACPRCGAPRILAPECPACGVIYVKAAAARAARPPAVAAPVEPVAPVSAVEPAPEFLPPLEPERPPHLPTESLQWHGHVDDALMEYRIRLFALPVALVVAWGIVSTSMGHRLVQLFASMWVHEFGHAITAWLCGYPAFPGPWATRVFETRSPLLSLLAAGAVGFWVWRSWMERYWPAVVGGALVLALQFTGTVLLSYSTIQQLIYFGGDAGNFILGTLLMASLYVRRESEIHQGWLRWGFLAIGACAFMSRFTLWVAAREDIGRIPFGANEGAGPSDPSMLADVYHWSVNQLVHRYVNLAVTCLTLLGVLYLVGLLQARSALRAVSRGG